jgi:hypothetical protein
MKIEIWSQHQVIRLKISSSYALKGHASVVKDVSANENQKEILEFMAKLEFGIRVWN